MNRIAGRAGITVLIAVLLVAGLVFFGIQYVTEADDWVIFPGSPHVYNGGNIGCGTVVDRDGTVLLDMNDGRTYSDSSELRKATVHWLGDRAGSVSAPALTHYASDIAGYNLVTGLYHYGDETSVAELTLSSEVQKAALEAMGDRKGTVAVYNYKTGEILCAVSTPAFDPDDVPNLEEDSEGKYSGLFVNRFTQGTYVPGSIFKIVTLAAVMEEKPEILDETFTCTGEMEFPEGRLTCEHPHGEQSVKQAFRNSCNVAFGQVAIELGRDNMQKYVEKFGVIDPVQFDGITTAAGNFDVKETADVSLGWSGIGQYKDSVNPCAFLTFVGAIASDGAGVDPYLVDNIAFGNSRTYRSQTHHRDRIMSADTARALQEYMRFNVEDKYGDDHFPGLTVCAKTGTAEVGEDQKPNAMLAGFTTDPQYPLAFIVCVENGGYGSDACIPVASQVLAACKESM